jgi:hypothetical protein
MKAYYITKNKSKRYFIIEYAKGKKALAPTLELMQESYESH